MKCNIVYNNENIDIIVMYIIMIVSYIDDILIVY